MLAIFCELRQVRKKAAAAGDSGHESAGKTLFIRLSLRCGSGLFVFLLLIGLVFGVFALFWFVMLLVVA